MFGLLKSRPCSIGVDAECDNIRLAQLAGNGKGIKLIAGRNRNRPDDIKPSSSNWQRWAAQTIRLFTANGDFHGKDVIAAIPASDVFIDHIRVSKTNDNETKLDDIAFSKIKQKLPFKRVKDNVMIKCIRTEDDNVLVIVTERKTIDRHLAIYEEANLRIKTIAVWPLALINCYTTFFGRRKSDIKAIVMLVSIETNCTNVVICRHKNILFARSISIGAKQLDDDDDKVVTRLVLELTACRRQFSSMHRNAQIERLIFLTGHAVDRTTCAAIAKQLEMPAQSGDCLAAVQISNPYRLGIDRRSASSDSDEVAARQKQQVNWATAFGLSLS